MGQELLNGRYEIRDKLGEGGMSVVYRAYDRESAREVALKLLKNPLSSTAQKRLVREFRAISTLQHPSCINVFDFGETADGAFFTMELFPGLPFTTLHGQPLTTILQALYQVASAIDYIHERGILHRDIKPSNILVRLTPNGDGQMALDVRLMDFGLARFLNASASLTDDTSFSGTLQYCAPEQITGKQIDWRADLYALALVAYESLTGCYPFEVARQSGVEGLIQAQLGTVPSSIQALCPDLPDEISRAIFEFLAKDPMLRPETTAPLRAAIAPAIGIHEVPEARKALPSTLLDPSATWQGVVGRARDLWRLREYFHRAFHPHVITQREWAGNPIHSVVFIVGEGGMGKTTLMREAVQLAQERGAQSLEGKCFEGNLAAYQPFVEILTQILERNRAEGATGVPHDRWQAPPPLALGGHGPSDAPPTETYAATAPISINSLVQDYTAEILRIAPDLRRWLPGEAFPQVDVSRETNYVLRAVSTFFVEVSRLRSTLLCLEDLQWADPSTLNLLRHLALAVFRAREAAVEAKSVLPRLAISCTLRPTGSETSRLIEELVQAGCATVVSLEALNDEEVRELASKLLNCETSQLGDSITASAQRVCGGNPFLVRQCVYSWKSSGELERDGGQWRMRDEGSDSVRRARPVVQVLQPRLNALSGGAREVLGASAVIGSRVPLEHLSAMCGEMAESDFLDAIEELVKQRILVEVPNAPDLSFAHDLLRELAYEGLSSGRRFLLHRRAAEVLQAGTKTGYALDVLAHHYLAAGDQQRAYDCLVHAGEEAFRAYAMDDAISFLTKARELGGASPGSEAGARLLELLATASSAAANTSQAIACYSEILTHATEPLQRARLLERIGELHFRVGESNTALAKFDQALTELGLRRTRSAAAVSLGAVYAFVLGFWRRWIHAPRPASGTARDRCRIAVDIFDRLALLLGQLDAVRSFHANGQQLVYVGRADDKAKLAQVYGQQAVFLGLYSLNAIARSVVGFAFRVAQQTQDAVVIAIARGEVGCIHYYGARLNEAEKCLREAVAVLDRRGDSWFRMFFYHNLRHLYSIRGDGVQELACARTELEISEAARDSEGTYYAEYGIANALARGGQVDEARHHMDRCMRFILRHNILAVPAALHTYGFVHLQAGDYRAALEVLRQSKKSLERDIAYGDYGIRCYPLLVEALLGASWFRAQHELDTATLGEAAKVSRRALFWGKRFPNYLAHALRACGRAAQAAGNTRRASWRFNQAIDAARKFGARYDEARSLFDLAKVDQSRSAEHEAAGAKILSDIKAVLPQAEC